MTDDIWWTVALMVSCFFLGWYLALRQEYWYIKMKASPEHRTAMHVDGQFFYVVPEKEYVAMLSAYIIKGFHR